jgi:hypothetical protein
MFGCKQLFWVLLVSVLLQNIVHAIGPWTFERLTRESDLVIICTIESTRVVNNDSDYGVGVYEMYITRVQPIAVLHGKIDRVPIEVKHYGVQQGKAIAGHPPQFIRFTGHVVLSSERSYLTGREHLYLLFLKESDNHFVPTSDQSNARASIVALRDLTRDQLIVDPPAFNVKSQSDEP